LEDATVVSIAKKLDRSPAQVLLRWALQQGIGKFYTVKRVQLRIFTANHLIEFKTSKWLLEASFVMYVRICQHFGVDLGVRRNCWGIANSV
jgi:hypothetical protein